MTTFLQPRFTLDLTTQSLDSRVTFVRTTNATNPATYVDSNGHIVTATDNQPRFDFDPVALACKGLLIEESRANVLLNSNSLNSWTKTNVNVTVDGSVVSPNGLLDTNVITATASGAAVSQNVTLTAGSWTYTVYARKGNVNTMRFRLRRVGVADIGDANFDLNAGAVISTAVGTASITPAKNGFYRCQLVCTAAAAGHDAYIYPNASGASTGNFIYTSDAQLEAGVFATSYISTTTTALTRNADVATITGTNFSDWWQAGFGGATVQALPSTVSGIRPLIQFDDGTANEIIALRGNITNPELYIVDGGVAQAQIDSGTIAANTAYRLTGWWDTDDCKARKDSGAVVTDTTATIPTVTQARLGSDGTNYLNGHLATINYYDQFSGQIYTRRKNKAVFTVI